MQEYSNELIRSLNQISRIAILENAPQTERTIRTLSNLMKYRFSEEDNMVICHRELLIAEQYLQFVETLAALTIHFSLNEETDSKSIFIPHFSLISYLMFFMQGIVDGQEKEIWVRVRIGNLEEKNEITMELWGNFDVWESYEEAVNRSRKHSYESIVRMQERWRARYGQDSIQVTKEMEGQQCAKVVIRMSCF